MIYLLQDSYLDDQDNLHKVLKIGYSKGNFEKTRKHHYDTHNYGYKFLGEREGDLILENILHKKYRSLRLNSEWFDWNQEIIDDFWNISGETITKEEYLKKLKEYTINKIILVSRKLSDNYLIDLLDELETIYNNGKEYQEVEFNRKDLKICIRRTWDNFCDIMKNQVEYLNFPEVLNSDKSLEIINTKNLEIDFTTLYNNINNRDKLIEYINSKLESTKLLLSVFNKSTEKEKQALVRERKFLINSDKYSNNYITISNKTNDFVLNKLIFLAEHKALDLQLLKTP
jgi:hypothetical protein